MWYAYNYNAYSIYNTMNHYQMYLNYSIYSNYKLLFFNFISLDAMGMMDVTLKFVLKFLTSNAKIRCISFSQEFLNDINDDPGFLKKIIRGDKTWIYLSSTHIYILRLYDQVKKPLMVTILKLLKRINASNFL